MRRVVLRRSAWKALEGMQARDRSRIKKALSALADDPSHEGLHAQQRGDVAWCPSGIQHRKNPPVEFGGHAATQAQH